VYETASTGRIYAAAGHMSDATIPLYRDCRSGLGSSSSALADQGDSMAETIVGNMHYYNHGVPLDWVSAYM
jgi:hypothetical protein